MLYTTKGLNHVKISGDAILPVVRAFSLQFLSRKLLSKYQLEDVDKGNFYNMQNYLELLHEVEENMPRMLFKIGKHIFTEAVFPPQVTTFEQGLSVVDQAYYMNHMYNEGEEIGHYHYEKLAENKYKMTVTCPYPCDFDQGIIEGIATKFNRRVSIKHDNYNCRQKEDHQCDYIVEVLN
jgi:hypothetical protein